MDIQIWQMKLRMCSRGEKSLKIVEGWLSGYRRGSCECAVVEKGLWKLDKDGLSGYGR